MHTIGILGSGRVGTTLAAGLAGAGHHVVVGTRTGARPGEWAGPELGFADHETTARQAAIVINATPGDGTLERLTALREPLSGKILVDVSNAAVHRPDAQPHAERLQEALPRTQVVKTLNTMFHSVMTDPHRLSVPPTAFLSGDDADAKATVRTLLAGLGWPPEWILDLGGISTAEGTEALVALVPHVMRSRGFAPFALTLAS
nr:NAD(P)-binding domain-containing protein [Amycolatopsis jejuensis]